MEGELKTAQVPGLTLSLIIFTPGLARLNGHLIGNGTGGDITGTYVLIFPSQHGIVQAQMV